MGCENSKLLRALRGEVVEPSPIWLMRQAGRYLPEYRETRAHAGSFLDLCFSPELATEVTLQPIRRFGFDAAILFSDILVIPWALGQRLDFVEGEGPRLEPVDNAERFATLSEDGMIDRLAPVFEAIRRIRAALDPEIPLIGFAGAPWTLATYVIGGRGSVDHAAAKTLARRDPDLFEAIVAMLTRSVSRLLAAQIEAGVNVVKLFDSWAGSAPANLHDAAILRPARDIVAEMRAKTPETPVIAFPRGFGAGLKRYASVVAPDALAIDTASHPRDLAELYDHVRCLQGNMDPMVLTETDPTIIERAASDQKAAFRGRPHIFNLGHGITPQAHPNSVAALIEAWRRV